MMGRQRQWVPFTLAVVLLGACAGGDRTTSARTSQEVATSAAGTTAAAPVSVSVSTIAASPAEDGPSALMRLRGGEVDGLPEPSVPLEELQAGGPPPDGIPPIDQPRFVRASAVDTLDDREAVLAVEVDGDARAYPVQIMIWHEIVNDTVGGRPIAVTYCPLCNSALVYDRRVAGRVLTFGTSGFLWNSSLVMYDRQTESLWSHFTGDAIAGVLTGTELRTISVAMVPWATWRAAHPDGLVLSRDTGHERDYGTNPYPGYDDLNGRPFLFEGAVDGRYTAMTRVVGVERDGAALAVPAPILRERRVVTAAVGGAEVVVLWQPGTASALDASTVAGGADVGATGVFERVFRGERLDLRADGDDYVDDRTGVRVDVLGRITAGTGAGERLTPVPHVDTFWFAWMAFRPDTVLAT